MRLSVEVEKQVGGFRLKVDFETHRDRLGIFGPSGCGKSTLVHLIAGLQSPDVGRIELDGDILFCSRQRVVLPPEQRRIALVFQQGHLFPHLSVRRNLLYGYRRTPLFLRKVEPEALIEILHLGDLLGRDVNTLSGGERQRVSLGRAILACPRLLIMDEPLSALDEALKYRIIPYLRSVFETFGIPFLFISHSLNEMRLMSEEVIMMSGGTLSQQIDPESLAWGHMSTGPGYMNLLHLKKVGTRDGMCVFRWGDRELFLSPGACNGGQVFELSAKDIVLFKKHPEAISARNLLPCRVVALHENDGRVGAELDCDGERLVCQIVQQAANELEIRLGAEVFAGIKASAFKVLY